uniref:Uncharacterized protein n=1 Tax=Trichogramma kaykai TaxID=54128 RepID=A0ABD2VTE3_9HYME
MSIDVGSGVRVVIVQWKRLRRHDKAITRVGVSKSQRESGNMLRYMYSSYMPMCSSIWDMYCAIHKDGVTHRVVHCARQIALMAFSSAKASNAHIVLQSPSVRTSDSLARFHFACAIPTKPLRNVRYYRTQTRTVIMLIIMLGPMQATIIISIR